MSYEPLHHKYRPQTFADLVGQETIANTLTNALAQSKIAPAYLFTGPRGTGKTSSARILAKSLNCLNSSQPTPNPCGQCEACLAIAKGTALDVIEIDAASNTGVDNIREIIDRSRFAPVQCRYKVYAIDECLSGDSLIQTSEGLIRIDNPKLKGKMVLSYNEDTKAWEYKKVLGWLERGTKETVVIKTSNHQIRCTENHLIRTATGWIKAGNVKEGMKILSPVSVDVKLSFTNMALMVDKEDLRQDISLKETNTEPNLITLAKSSNKQKLYNLYVNADVKKNSIFPTFSKKPTTTSNWEQNPVANGCLTYNNTQSPQWTTNLEKVESVSHVGHEKVYDLEVEDNHNFVANGLLVHNCHMLSTAAFNALLKTLEEPPPNVVFILATTDPQRVLSTIISRCQRFDYRRIHLQAMVSHLQDIAQAENIIITDEAMTLVAQLANGGLRDAESLLDQLSLLPEQITVEKVWDLVGAVSEQDLLVLLKAIHSDRHELVLQTCRNLLDRGREPLVVLQNLASFYLNLAIAKTAPQQTNLVAVTEACWQELCSEATHWELPLILRGQQQLKEAENQLKNTTQPRLWLEVTLLSLLPGLNKESASTLTPIPPAVVAPQSREGLVQTTVKQVRQSPPEQPISQPETITAPETEAEVKVNITKPTQGLKFTKAIAEEELPTKPLVVEPTAPISSTDTSKLKQPASNNLQPTAEPVANQQLWSQVIACLHPPTTKALLSQQCHLISFNGSSAVVGISSTKLQKLHQGRVPNIEAAFSQVCQQKIKVSLQVAIPQGQETPRRSPANTPTFSPKSFPEKFPEKSSSERSPSVDAQSITLPKTSAANDNGVERPESELYTTQLPPKLIQTPPTSEVPVSQPITPLESVSEDTTTDDYSSEELQRAIESLTQSFEGEVVQLEDKVFAPPEEIEIIDIPKRISNITLGNRPDLSNYDDDDVPF